LFLVGNSKAFGASINSDAMLVAEGSKSVQTDALGRESDGLAILMMNLLPLKSSMVAFLIASVAAILANVFGSVGGATDGLHGGMATSANFFDVFLVTQQLSNIMHYCFLLVVLIFYIHTYISQMCGSWV
jgi:hypothetical protein